jgi:hypothetical protein
MFLDLGNRLAATSLQPPAFLESSGGYVLLDGDGSALPSALLQI